MADSMADYSKIQELVEIRRLYEELQDKHESELAGTNSRVEYLESELRQRSDAQSDAQKRLGELEETLQQARNALDVQRKDHETKVERLQGRIKELSGAGTGADAGRSGFFRR